MLRLLSQLQSGKSSLNYNLSIVFMRTVVQTSRFKKDLKRMSKRALKKEKLVRTVQALVEGTPLPQNACPHILSGEFIGITECHISPDWLLLYEVTQTTVYLYRTGSHADLFE